MQKILARLGFFSVNVHPFLFYNISLILGIIAAYSFPNNNYHLITLLSFIFILIFACFKKMNLKIIYILIFFPIGFFVYKNQINNFSNFKQITNGKKFDLIGSITDISVIEHSKNKNCITFNVEKIKEIDSQNWQNINKPVQLYVKKVYSLKVADKIKILNVQFNYSKNIPFEDYIIKEGLLASLFLYKFNYKFINRPKISFNRWIHNFKTNLFYRLKSKIGPETFALFSSIFLGNKNCIKDQMEQPKELFKIWGLSHYLARSGLHLVIIVAIWFYLMSLLKINFKIKDFIGFILILIYHILSWSSIPFTRSLIMFILLKICLFFDLQINGLHLLNLTCFSILLLNPIQILFLDFQLSFGLTYALIWISYTASRKQIS